MAKQLRETVGTFSNEKLIADASVSTDVVTVTIAKTDAVQNLKRGTVLEVDAAGKCALFAQTAASTAAYVLAEDVDTSTSADVTGVAYQTGKFNKNALITEESKPLTVKALKELRDAGIFVETVID